MTDIPEYRFVDAELEPGLERTTFLAWDGSTHIPHAADPRTYELRRLPGLEGTAERFYAWLSADGTSVISSHHRWLEPGIVDHRILQTLLPTLLRSPIAQTTSGRLDHFRQSFDIKVDVILAAQSRAATSSSPSGSNAPAWSQSTTLSLSESGGELTPALEIPGHQIRLSDEAMTAAQLSPDSSRIAFSVNPQPVEPGMNSATTAVVDSGTGEAVAELGVYGLHGTQSWSPDGRRLLVRNATTLAILDVDSGILTSPPGLPREIHLQPKKRVHRVQGWYDDNHVVSVFQEGPINSMFAVNIYDGATTPLCTVKKQGLTLFHIAANLTLI
ncbi:hypothetical protein [Sanguibacter massiliensis]|uniref:hypothetical protein n=1 Tax=Sanguibacter massiliensis TaxID=1973217 RepID=UPI00101AE3E0|nr:hypothetical protein [Sanguibacter massiliensis]